MIIRSAKFISSSSNLSGCPLPDKPDFAFTGRSNVGKSSLINMLTSRNKLARVSRSPGRTRTINHFLINDEWYLVDLPGYGYAGTSSETRKNWQKETYNYIINRKNLFCIFVLIDIRIKPQSSDLRFMETLGTNRIPFVRVFTKSDKLRPENIAKRIREYDKIMLETWEELPVTFVTSSVTKAGRNEILDFIEETVNKSRKDL
ncbi:MAG TPA: ribosome biogenesis GTP-binding protein YihA/YsxC [Bacteroidales bacterium]|nr:YihA family ribosome biogenesis GTP-binding protein [Bacteroidales bacterium]HCI55115.1 YihA family ribosome biogenesis GTP-binding protein [Bacteroidales bacterium]HOU96711.1 ribosome biogenesis GTP-binding protein YihA/YsxC [Bacteroidales bacterium]HQG35862.1 ribosome biogenesis GTP-binding protein YihA/YsxC [Bacteroidales bacterium]HQG52372.1 ribosome biogenesis GTP-binding protein YihA/YsxC [Bacteroidales bacterium]